MYTFILVIHVFVSLFLIFIILIQSSKGEGLADVFGGGSSQTTIFGSRTGTFLTRATAVCAILFMITCVSLGFLSKQRGASVVQQQLLKEQAAKKVNNMLGGKKQANPAPETSAQKSSPVPAKH